MSPLSVVGHEKQTKARNEMTHVGAVVYDVLANLCGSSLVTLFVVAAAGKMLSFHAFRRSLRSLPWMTSGVDWLVAVSVPLLELLISIGLLLGNRVAACGAAVLLAIFSGVAYYVVQKRLLIPCNCFGAGQGMLSTGTIRRNSGLIIVALMAATRPQRALDLQEILCGATIVCLALNFYQTWVAHNLVRRLIDIGGLPSHFYQNVAQ